MKKARNAQSAPKTVSKSATKKRDKLRPQDAASEAKTLLENLQLLDDLLSRKTLSGNRVALLNFQRSILNRLSLLHGYDAELLAKTLSGASWVSKFPDSKSTASLDGSFASGVDKFIDSMTAGGANVVIGTTLRPKERAYLMHYAYLIANDQIQPTAVPSMSGVEIEWEHGDAAASKQAAEDMVAGYGIVAKPALNSRHTEGKAIDMTISWSGTLSLKDKSGSIVKITTSPRSGENTDLAKVGMSFGVIKASFPGDPPHWSNDGH